MKRIKPLSKENPPVGDENEDRPMCLIHGTPLEPKSNGSENKLICYTCKGADNNFSG